MSANLRIENDVVASAIWFVNENIASGRLDVRGTKNMPYPTLNAAELENDNFPKACTWHKDRGKIVWTLSSMTAIKCFRKITNLSISFISLVVTRFTCVLFQYNNFTVGMSNFWCLSRTE